MLGKLLALALGLLAWLRGNDRVTAAHAEAQRDRAEADLAAAQAADPADELMKRFNRDGPHAPFPALALITMTVCLSACTPPAPPVVADTYCDLSKPILITRSDVLTAETARQILAHDDLWEMRCKRR